MLCLGRLGLYGSVHDRDDGWILGIRFFRNAAQAHFIWVYFGAAWFAPRWRHEH